ncbi:MAG: hypothetical protein WCR54_06470 [Clostridia bacterium]
MKNQISMCTIIDYNNIHLIGTINKKIMKTIVIPNPLKMLGTFVDIQNAYLISKNDINSILIDSVSDLITDMLNDLECDNIDILGIATNGTFAKILLNLPLNTFVYSYNKLIEDDIVFQNVNSLYFLPIYNEFIGGDTICKLIALPDFSGLVVCDNICIVAILGKEKDQICALWDIEFTSLEIDALAASILTLSNSTPFSHIIYLCGENNYKLFEMVEALNFTHIEKEIDYEYYNRACFDQNFRRKLELQKDRLEYLDLANNELFQSNLINSTSHLF